MMEDKTTYCVSGYMRTGTSMMMKALEAGGMTACFKEAKDDIAHRYAREDYHPNINGLYELEDADYRQWDFPRGYEGKLIKSLNAGVTRFARMTHGIKVVFMMRDPIEIQASFIKFFGQEICPRQMATYKRDMIDIGQRINNRKDVLEITPLSYDFMLDNPRFNFEVLKDNGWPIDVDKAIAVIDPNLRHCDVTKPETIAKTPNLNYPSAMILGGVK